MIPGGDKLVSIFGYWPSFHDAEVVSITLDRRGGDDGPTLTADIHLHEMTPEVDPAGYYVLRHHTLATLLFSGVDELRIDGFNGQNAIMGLDITEIGDRQLERVRYEVTFTAAYGVDAQFVCWDAEVVAARPWDPANAAPGRSDRPQSPAKPGPFADKRSE